MSKKTGYLLGILLTIIIGTLLYWVFCCKPCLEDKQTAIEAEKMEALKPEIETTTKNTFSAIDLNSSIKFNTNTNFNFKESNFSIQEPIAENLKNEVDRLSTYLKDNPEKTIDITGHFTSKENNTSAFPNLGLARANAVKNYFVSHGMSSKLINTFGELDDNFVSDQSNIFYGPVSFGIKTKGENALNEDDALKLIRDEIRANPLILYFNTASASISLSKSQKEKVARMIKYVDKVDDASIITIGHTDNVGSRATNIRLGKDRAEFAKIYLASNGIASEKIKSSSKGPDAPIADNNTDEGKAKNRRVEVTIN